MLAAGECFLHDRVKAHFVSLLALHSKYQVPDSTLGSLVHGRSDAATN
jgi:hypothetical protein